MARRYRDTVTIHGESGGAEGEIEVAVSYTVAWGAPERGRFGPPENYDPGSPDDLEDIRIENVDGRVTGWCFYRSDALFAEDIIDSIENSGDLTDQLLQSAREQEEAHAPD